MQSRLFQIVKVLVLLSSMSPLVAQTNSGFTVDIQQAPQFKEPVAGSVSGNVEAWLSSDPSSRGSFAYSLPLQFDTGRAPLLVSPAPTWSPGQGLSEWGLGWSDQLRVKRVNLLHEVDFATDYLQSPWGLLVPGSDGFWYPQGLTSKVRVRAGRTELSASFPDGSLLEFSTIVADDENLVWTLTKATDARGYTSLYEYQEIGVDRRFLSTVSWGLSEKTITNRVKFIYEALPASRQWRSYRFGGTPATLDRRVNLVEFFQIDSGIEKARWSYKIAYKDNVYGPGFYLTSLQQIFSSGEKRPAQLLTWGDFAARLDGLAPEVTARLHPIISKIGMSRLHNQYVTVADFNHDGYPDIEVAQDNSIFYQTDDGFGAAVPRPISAGSRGECRKKADPSNTSRSIMPLGGYKADDVVVATKSTTAGVSQILVCSLDGSPVLETKLDGDFGPDSRVRIVDLNHDGRPDLLRIQRGNYFVAQNTSEGGSYSFAGKRSYPLDVNFNPSASEPYFLSDVNGDGFVDLVLMRSGNILVAYGKGNMVFGPEVNTIRAFDLSNQTFNFQGYELKPLDANRDGLTDFLAVKNGRYSLLINDGNSLREYNLSRLQAKLTFTKYLFADLMGDGVAKLIQAESGGQAKTLDLTGTSNAMLQSLDDGLGNLYSFTWDKGPATPYVGERPSVLKSIQLTSTGEESRTIVFQPREPQVHSQVPMFLGFQKVSVTEGNARSIFTFFQNDSIQGLLTQKSKSDSARPGLFLNSFKSFLATDYNGVPYQRLVREESGFGATGDDLSVSTIQTWADFDENLCARTSNTDGGAVHRALKVDYFAYSVDQFPFACFQKSVQLGSTSGYLRWSYERDSIGLVTSATQYGQGTATVLQRLGYDDLHRLISQRDSTGKSSTISYVADTMRILSLSDELGVVRNVDTFGPGDLPQTMSTINDGAAYQEAFAWDGQERLSSILHGLYALASGDAHQQFFYQLSTSIRPGVLKEIRSIDGTKPYSIFSIKSASGNSLATALGTGQGYLYDGRQRNTQAGRQTSFFAPIDRDIDPLLAGLKDFLGDDEALATQLKDVFGFSLASTTTFESTSKGSSGTILSFDEGLLKSTVLTNKTFAVSRWTDAAGLVRRIQLENGATYKFDYDWNARLIQVTLPSGAFSDVSYDERGRKKSVHRSLLGSVVYFYDDLTNLASGKDILDEAGQKIRSERYMYDPFGRMTEVKHFDEKSTIYFRQRYDGDTGDGHNPHQMGLLSFEEGADYQRTYQYSLDSRLTSRKTVFDRAWILTEGFVYEWDGSIQKRTVEFVNTRSGFKKFYTLTHIKDAQGRIADVLLDGQSIAKIAYDALNRVASISDGQGRIRVPIYDSLTTQPQGWTETNGKDRRSFGMHYDERGFITNEDFSLADDDRLKMFQYDANGFVSHEHIADQVQTYAYDVDGLRSSSDRAFDALGRLQSTRTHTLTYGVDGQLLSAVNPAGLIRYSYDVNGQRILKFRNGDIDTAFAGDVVIKGDKIFEILRISNQLYGILDNGSYKSVSADHLGTPFIMNDGVMDVASAYGENTNSSQHEILAFAYEGRDLDTGLIRFGARDYDSKGGLFTTPDPLFFENPDRCLISPVECNLYSYARNNPLKYVDPTGTDSADIAMTRFEMMVLNGNKDQAMNEAGARAAGAVAGLGISASVAFGPEAAVALGNGSNSLLLAASLRLGALSQTGSKVADFLSNAIYALGEGPRSGNGPRVFWSGGDAARNAAEGFAKTVGGTTLEMTEAGRNLSQVTKGMDWLTEARPLWTKASAEFAREAEGTVFAFQNGTRGVSLESVWRTVEFPILKEQGNNIIYQTIRP